ncbi:hypothetical protein PS910_03772 [Pseudomonas fluorescens]|nr:hypothetical protein PS910_03772 [Pseudomonas fluorescens]
MNKTLNTTLQFYQGNDVHMALSAATTRIILRNQGQALAEQHGEGAQRRMTLVAADSQGSVVGGQDQEARSFRYTAFGFSPEEDATILLTGFNGEIRNSQTGCYLLGNGYRAFDPVVMRFHSPDSYSPFGSGGINTYGYCEGNPANLKDPTGHSPWRPRPTPVNDQGKFVPAKLSTRVNSRSQRQVQVQQASHSRSPSGFHGPTRGITPSSPENGQQQLIPLDLAPTPRYIRLKTEVRSHIANNHHIDTAEFYTQPYRDYKSFRHAAAELIIESEQSMGMANAKKRFFSEWPEANVEKVRHKILQEIRKIRSATLAEGPHV